MIINIFVVLIVLAIGYLIVVFLFDLLLRGFMPFIKSRPWAADQIVYEIELNKENPKMLAFSSGRSGVFRKLEKKYPESARMIGIEPGFFPYLVAKAQSWLKKTKIQVKRQELHRVNVKDYDLIYSHLYPDDLRGLGRKFKFECKPGTLIVSTGFNIPFLIPKKIVPIEDRKGKYDFLSKNQKLFQSKKKKFKKENKAFFYEI